MLSQPPGSSIQTNEMAVPFYVAPRQTLLEVVPVTLDLETTYLSLHLCNACSFDVTPTLSHDSIRDLLLQDHNTLFA